MRSSRNRRRYRKSARFNPGTEFRTGKREAHPDRVLGKGAAAGLTMIAGVFIAGLAMAYWSQETPGPREQAISWASADEPRVQIGEHSVGDAQEQNLNASEGPQIIAQFDHCGMVRRTCVVDGDTFWIEGEKIRIADIDTPEVSQPKCQSEKQLGDRATERLIELLNAGPFELHTIGDRDTDRYGRKLRVIVRNGRSLGDQLVSEGLARTWTGRREPWC